jgi:peptidyl-prolyl cis-trans isomerase SDCCAG10
LLSFVGGGDEDAEEEEVTFKKKPIFRPDRLYSLFCCSAPANFAPVVDDPLPTALVPEYVAKPPPPPAPVKAIPTEEAPKVVEEGSKKKKKKDKAEDDELMNIREKHAKEQMSARFVHLEPFCFPWD